jgi:hypothetical protein
MYRENLQRGEPERSDHPVGAAEVNARRLPPHHAATVDRMLVAVPGEDRALCLTLKDRGQVVQSLPIR